MRLQVVRRRGRSGRARSSRTGCGTLVCSRVWPTIRKGRPASPRSGRNCSDWAGTDGRNMRLDIRWGGGDAEFLRKLAAELVALAPDVLFSTGTASHLGPSLQATRAVPIVFASVIDPVGAGFVESLARPGGNATGFLQFEYSLSGKWLELLREIAPGVKRAAVLRDHNLTAGIGQFAALQAVAPSGVVDFNHSQPARPCRDRARPSPAFTRYPDGGLIVTASALSIVHRDLIIMACGSAQVARSLDWDRLLRFQRRAGLLRG